MAGTKVPRDPNLPPEHRRFLDDLSRQVDELNAASNAPASASYVTLGTDATLPSERVLTAGTNISLTDAGAGSTLTVAYTGQSGGLTHLTRLSLGSGASQSTTGLASSKMLILQFMHVSHNSGSNQNLQVALSVNNGSSYGTPVILTTVAFAAAAEMHGMATIGRADSGASHPVMLGFLSGFGGEDTQSGAVNALQFSWTGGSFDNAPGFVDIYGLN